PPSGVAYFIAKFDVRRAAARLTYRRYPGGAGLQRPNPLYQVAAALALVWAGAGAGAACARRGSLCGIGLPRQDGLDPRARPFQLHGEVRDLRGNVVDALAQ